ncbi:MAG: hypothetical protein R3B57_04445 [Phycisphaerales bacterium]
MLALGVVTLGMSPAHGWAQQLQLEARPASENSVEPPGPVETMEAYKLVRTWVDAGEAPESPPVGVLPRAGGASVVLMRAGRVVGRGDSMSESGDTPGRAIWRAAKDAIDEARRHPASEEDDDAKKIALSLELAGAPVPMSGAELISPALTLSPGLDGIAVRRGDTLVAAFPGAILRRNTDAGRAIGSLVTGLTGNIEDALTPPTKLAERGLQFYRFRVSHVAEPKPGDAAVFLHRGGRVVDVRELTTPALVRFAEGVAAHLEARRWPGVERFGLLSTFDPIAGRHEGMVEEATAQAVAALALARLARTPGVDRGAAENATRAARGILSDLVVVEDAERLAPIDPESGDQVSPPPPTAWEQDASAAACVIALAELGSEAVAVDPDLTLLRDKTLKRLDASFDAKEGFASGVEKEATGLVAYGIVRAFTVFGRGDAARARAAVASVYTQTPANLLVSQMPWLGWADIELSRAEGRSVASASLLREMRAEVWAHQLTRADVSGDDADLLGGIVFTRGRAVLPTWHSARPLAVIATMLGERGLTPGWIRGGEAPGELIRLLDSVRFLRQLAADPSVGHMYARPERAMWGVRQALWDQRMPTDASALTLLTVCETVRSLDELGRRAERSP